MNEPTINPKRSATAPAYIYKITSPSGKSYIGQTIYTPERRWKEHVKSAMKNSNQCRMFENAIRKHGAAAFTHEILLLINENMVDYYEAKFIVMCDTLSPNGYNLRAGGDGGCTEEMRAQMRIGNNKKIANKSWKYEHHPKEKYVYWYHEINKHGTPLEGYRVSDHPNGRRKVFSDSGLTMDERYRLAVEYRNSLDNVEEFHDEREKRPMHMGRYNVTGYKVRFPGIASKWFYTGDEDVDKKDAYEFLISVCPDYLFDKVFKDCEIPI